MAHNPQTHERAMADLRRINSELRNVQLKFLFSQRRTLARAIVAIDEVTGDLPPQRDAPFDATVLCACGRAELTLPNKYTGGLKFESKGMTAIGTHCPHCKETVKDIQARRRGEPNNE